MLRPRQPLFEYGLCAVAGIVLADRFAPPPLITALVAGLALAGAFRIGRHESRRPRRYRAPDSRLLLWLGVAALFAFWHGWRLEHEGGRWLAAQIPEQGRVFHGIGVVDEDPPSSSRFILRLETVTLDGTVIPTDARILVHWPHDPPAYGDRLEFTGSARNLRVPRNPGEFDNPAYRRRQQVHSLVRVRYPRDAKLLGHDGGNPLIAASLRLRRWMEVTMTRDLEDSPKISAVIASVVLGSRAESMREVQLLFAHTGTLHLFAVSGMNVAMIAASLSALLLILRVPRRAVALLVIPLLWIYCYVTGLTPSSLRATIMATLILGGIAQDRPALSWNVLGAAALLILLWDTHQLFAPGFQLSFLLVAVLLLAVAPATRYFQRFGKPDPFLPRLLWSRWQRGRVWLLDHGSAAVAVSLVAWVGSVPLTALYFHLFSPSSVPANLIAGGLAWIMLMLGLASAAAGTLWTGLSVLLNNANWLFARTLLESTAFLASFPGSHFYVDHPSLSAPPRCEITVLDLEGGAAVHLRFHTRSETWPHRRLRRDWLIDCGSRSGYQWVVSPYLKTRGVNRLDGLLLTHGDSGHLGGALALLETMPVADVLDSPYRDRSPLRRKVHSVLAEGNAGKTIVCRGDVVTLAPGITLHVLFPSTGRTLRTADDKALVFRLDVDERLRILFASDAGFLTEQWLLEQNEPEALRSHLLIKGIHAADLSGTPEFLAAVAPEVVVTSGTDFPPRQRVDETWARGLEERGIRLLRQDRCGAVRIVVDETGHWSAQGLIPSSRLDMPDRSR